MSNTNETVGVRIFNEHPRLHDDKIWIELVDIKTGEHIFRGPLQNGGHNPLEIYCLPKDSSVFLKMDYEWLAKESIHSKRELYQQLIQFSSDVDVRINWTDINDIRGDSSEMSLERKPVVTITEGHPPLF